MRALISTTLGHNPGDEIIALGVKRIVRELAQEPVDFVLYNRNPDLQEGSARTPKAGLVGNYLCNEVDLSHFDVAVLAGSPEWTGGPVKPLYEAIAKRKGFPLLALGVGLGDPSIPLSELDKEVLGRPETTIITRSLETTRFLYDKHNIRSRPLPCPALFAFDKPRREGFRTIIKTLQIAQAPGRRWHEIKESCLSGLNFEHDVLAVHIKELQCFNPMAWPRRGALRYAGDTDSFRNIVPNYGRVLSTRLHGAIGALSLGIPAVVIADGDFRIETAARMFGDILPIAKDFKAGYALIDGSGVGKAGGEAATLSPLRILKFKETIWNTYLKELREWA